MMQWNRNITPLLHQNGSIEVYENDSVVVEVRRNDGITTFDALLVSDGEYARITIRKSLSFADQKQAIEILLARICEHYNQPDLYFWSRPESEVEDALDITEDVNDSIHDVETAQEGCATSVLMAIQNNKATVVALVK